jgi:hypothetical protein
MPDGSFEEGKDYATAKAVYEAKKKPGPPAAPAPPVTVNGVLTPVEAFAGRSTIRFGIGEVVNLSFTTTPAGRSAASLGGLKWVATTGAQLVTLANDAGNTGTGRVTSGPKAGIVALALQTAGAPAVTKATKQFVIVTPNDAVMTVAASEGTLHKRGMASAGFRGNIYLRPTDVSFKNLEFREGGASYEGTGIFQKSEASLADLKQEFEIIHPVNGEWHRVNGGDHAVSGSKVGTVDEVLLGTSKRGAGTFKWTIPWYVRVVGSIEEIRVKTAEQSAVTDANGKMTISKAGASVTKNLNDPDENLEWL